MNDRIKELSKQAGGDPNYSAFQGHYLPPPLDYIDPATVELIIQECIEIVEKWEVLFEKPLN